MDAYRHELFEVKRNLRELEEELEDMLMRQSMLIQRKSEIEAILLQSSCATIDDSPTVTEHDKKWEGTNFPWFDDLDRKMKSVFKIQKLRPMQLQTMNVTMSGKDCVLIMPTGGGKSLCFQLPAVVSKGITLVVSPLISLMEDQIMALEGLAVDATMLNASCSKEKVKQVQDAMIDKNAPLKLLYVTPEKLAKSKRFMARLEKMYKLGRFSRLVIDEVHCCSQWGHDFRPDYKFLGIMKRQFPGVPILGLTATATLKVLDDVKKMLNIPDSLLFRASFNRPNLYYEVRPKPASHKDTMDELQKLIQGRFPRQSGIIYCFSRKDAETVASDLHQRGIKSAPYHADLHHTERSRVHKLWLANQIHVVVATVAFGMGIDKPDVRFVIHHSISKSMENLYQESGRAGRDDKTSACIICFRLVDLFRQSGMVMAEQTGLENLYGIIAYCIDQTRCRRSVIAHHFGEVWDSTQCHGMCDHCDPEKKGTIESRDVTPVCQKAIKILDEGSRSEQRLTALKLVDCVLKEKIAGTSREDVERILAHMIVSGYLKEDFHFTPYSTISYLLPGSRTNALRNGVTKVTLDFKVKTKGSHLSTRKSKRVTCNSDAEWLSTNAKTVENSNKKTEKPKLLVIHPEKSKFTSCMPNVSLCVKKLSSNTKSKSTKMKRKKPVISESDEDLDGLDFGDGCGSQTEPPKKKSLDGLNGSISEQNPGSVKSITCSRSSPISIEDSDDEFGSFEL